MKVLCNECKKDFEPNEKEKYLGAMITEKYIVCPHCGKKTIITLNNSLTRKLERSINILKTALSGKGLRHAGRTAIIKHLDNNINIHKKAMSLLMKEEYSWRYQTK